MEGFFEAGQKKHALLKRIGRPATPGGTNPSVA